MVFFIPPAIAAYVLVIKPIRKAGKFVFRQIFKQIKKQKAKKVLQKMAEQNLTIKGATLATALFGLNWFIKKTVGTVQEMKRTAIRVSIFGLSWFMERSVGGMPGFVIASLISGSFSLPSLALYGGGYLIRYGIIYRNFIPQSVGMVFGGLILIHQHKILPFGIVEYFIK